MTVYSPNIPQPSDNPSNSQDQILQNFQTLESIYGTSGDHYAWDNVNTIEQAKHAKVTLPGLPTATTPGNVLPTPVSGSCSIFAQTISGITTPYLVRDGLAPTSPLTNIWPIMPIKAFVTISITTTTTGTILQSYNINSVFNIGPVGRQVQFGFMQQMRTSTYGVLALASGQALTLTYGNLDQFSFTIFGNFGAFNPYTFTAIVLEP